ncbi:hypothetical protein HMPREF0378_0585 [Eubacterium nodatum ATCC 33099]|nr:hypothetical protein HMPREF0378_0585 [Eubacterium nodatum ATCC 33099]
MIMGLITIPKIMILGIVKTAFNRLLIIELSFGYNAFAT